MSSFPSYHRRTQLYPSSPLQFISFFILFSLLKETPLQISRRQMFISLPTTNILLDVLSEVYEQLHIVEGSVGLALIKYFHARKNIQKKGKRQHIAPTTLESTEGCKPDPHHSICCLLPFVSPKEIKMKSMLRLSKTRRSLLVMLMHVIEEVHPVEGDDDVTLWKLSYDLKLEKDSRRLINFGVKLSTVTMLQSLMSMVECLLQLKVLSIFYQMSRIGRDGYEEICGIFTRNFQEPNISSQYQEWAQAVSLNPACNGLYSNEMRRVHHVQAGSLAERDHADLEKLEPSLGFFLHILWGEVKCHSIEPTTKAQVPVFAIGKDDKFPIKDEAKILKCSMQSCKDHNFKDNGHFLHWVYSIPLLTIIIGTRDVIHTPVLRIRLILWEGQCWDPKCGMGSQPMIGQIGGGDSCKKWDGLSAHDRSDWWRGFMQKRMGRGNG